MKQQLTVRKLTLSYVEAGITEKIKKPMAFTIGFEKLLTYFNYYIAGTGLT